MGDIRLNQFSAGTGSGTPNNSDSYTSGTLKARRFETDEDIIFPAGAYRIRIHSVEPGEFILVNGEEISHGGEFERAYKINEADKIIDFIDVVDVVAVGVEYWFDIEYPSNHPINI